MVESTQPNIFSVRGQGLSSLSARSDSFSPPDLKLVHSRESTNIESPGFTSKSLSLSLCWGWSGCYWLLGESLTYCWFSRNLRSPCFDLTERNESSASLLTNICPGTGRLTDIDPPGPYPVPDTHWVCRVCWANAQIMTRLMVKVIMWSISALSLWGLRVHFILVQWFFNVLVMLHLCLVHLLKTTHYSKCHRFHVCMLFLPKSSYKEVGNHTVLSPVCLWFTKTKQNHII